MFTIRVFCAKRKKNTIGPSCYSKRSIFWAQVAAEILGGDYVWNDKRALCWDMHVWELLDHEGVHLFPEEERNVKTKMGRKVQVAPSSVALSSVMAPTATTRLCATAGLGRDCV